MQVLIATLYLWSSISALPDWVVYLYMQADTEQGSAERAISMLEQGLMKNSQKDIHIYIEVQGGVCATRYHLDKHGKKVVAQYLPAMDQCTAIKEGCAWVFKNPAHQRMLIFSGHGTGILDPTWDAAKKRWLLEPDVGDSLYTRYIAQHNAELLEQIIHAADCKSLLLKRDALSCLSHQQLVDVIRFTSENILAGAKIDIIGFDACHMAMLEVAYDLRHYAHYFVASQECEEREGWDYDAFPTLLSQNLPSYQIARGLVYSYDTAQRRKGHRRYSLSAFDLSEIASVATAVDAYVEKYNATTAECPGNALDQRLSEESLEHDSTHSILRVQGAALSGKYDSTQSIPRVQGAALVARHNNQKFCSMPMYADLYDFFERLLSQLELMHQTEEVEQLQESLLKGMELLQRMVIASAVGPDCSKAHGCSIYFPVAHIDSSYTGGFAKERGWLSFLRIFCESTLSSE